MLTRRLTTHRSSIRYDRTFLLLILAAGLYVFWDAGRPFVQTDDFWYAGIVSEMVATGDYLTPRFNGAPQFGNPPLAHWVNAPIVALVDRLPVAMRIVPGVSFLLILCILYDLGRRLWSREVGWLAAAVFMLCYDHYYNHGYKSAGMEGLLHLELAAIWWLNARLAERPALLRWIGLCTGLVFMTKTAFAAPPALLTAINLWWLRREPVAWRRLIFHAVGLALLAAVPWLLAISWRHGPVALERILGLNVWQRFLGHATFEQMGRLVGRQEPLYALRHYLSYGQPWALLVWPAILAVWTRWGTIPAAQRRALGLAVVWHVAVLAVFLVSRGRWAWHIASIYLPGALLIAVWLSAVWKGAWSEDRATLLALTAAACLMTAAPFSHNPFRIPAGSAPLAEALWKQLAVGCALVALFHRAPPHVDSARPVRAGAWRASLITGGIAGVAVLIAWNSAGHPAWAKMVRWIPVFLVGGLLHRLARAGRPTATAAVVALLVLGTGYAAAPFQYAFAASRRAELDWMERLIRQGYLSGGRTFVQPKMVYYAYVVLHQSYAPEYRFTYNPVTRTLTIQRTL